MRPLCSGVLWLAPTVAWWFRPSPRKPCEVERQSLLGHGPMCVGLAPAPNPVPPSGRPWPEWQRLVLGVHIQQNSHQWRWQKTSFPLSSFLCLKIVKSPRRSPSLFLPFPTVHLSLPLHVSLSLFIQFGSFLPPIYPSLLFARLTAEEKEQRDGEERRKGGVDKKWVWGDDRPCLSAAMSC